MKRITVDLKHLHMYMYLKQKTLFYMYIHVLTFGETKHKHTRFNLLSVVRGKTIMYTSYKAARSYVIVSSTCISAISVTTEIDRNM